MRAMALIVLFMIGCGQGASRNRGFGSIPQDSLLPDGTFENGLGNWQLDLRQSGRGSLSASPGSGYEGNRAAQVTVSATDGTGWHVQLVGQNRNIIPLAENRTYRLSLWVKSRVARSFPLRIALATPSAGTALPYQAVGGETVASTATQWTEVVHRFSTKRPVQNARVVIAVGAYAGETYSFDSIRLTEITSRPPPSEPGPPVPLRNPGIESDFDDDWRLATLPPAAANLSRDPTVAHTGWSSARIEVTSTNGMHRAAQFIASIGNQVVLQANHIYELRFWAKSDVSRDQAFHIAVTGPAPFQAIGGSMMVPVTGQWQQYRHTFRTDQAYSNARITIAMGKYGNAVYYLDDLSMTDNTDDSRDTTDR